MKGNTNTLMERITISPEVLAGKPVIRGTRLSVQFILGLIASGAPFQEILDEYSDLSKEDIEACLAFAIDNLNSTVYFPLSA